MDAGTVMAQARSEMTLIQGLHEVMCDLEQTMLENQKRGQQISHLTMFFTRLFITLFILFSVFLGYQAYHLSTDVRHLADHMVDMYDHFGKMSDDMDAMTKSVVKMETRVRMIPVMTAEISRIVSSVKTMRTNVERMSVNVTHMDKNLRSISTGVNDMSKRFLHLNTTVNYMQKNVSKMALPLSNIPFF